MLRYFILFIVCIVDLAGDPAFAQGKRVALVIGNSYYKVSPLANPTNDAGAVAAAFSGLGFETTLRKDLTIDGMRRELSAFGQTTVGTEMAVVFFAGHGTEMAGRNYLIPVDAQLKRAADIELEAVALETVIAQIEGARLLKLVILDACRNNIFPMAGAKRSMSRGLARVEPGGNTLVAYAAKEGTLADDGTGAHNSPFTAALLKNMVLPSLDIRLMFGGVRDDVLAATNGRQEPYLYGTAGRQAIYLSTNPTGPSALIDIKTKRKLAAPIAISADARLKKWDDPYSPKSPEHVVHSRLQANPLWQLAKREFPDWYVARVLETAQLNAERKDAAEISRHQMVAMIKLRHQHLSEALSASLPRMSEIASAFHESLVAMAKHSTAACYGFISQGELSPLVLTLLEQPTHRQHVDRLAMAIFLAVDEGRKTPHVSPPPTQADYQLLTVELVKLGWSDTDLKIFSDALQLSKAMPEKVCGMVRDWFAAQLAVADLDSKKRLLAELLRPVLSAPSLLARAEPASTPAPSSPISSAVTTQQYVNVLGSRRSRMDALEVFADLQEKYRVLLGTGTPEIRETNLGDKGTWYRILFGPPRSLDAAKETCARLKAQGFAGDCWAIKY